MKSRRLVWIVVLLFYVSGCTTYAPVTLPDDYVAPTDDPVMESGETLELGMRVKLYLKNGEEAEGTVIQITEESLVFGKPGNYGLRSEIFLFQDVESMEVAQSTVLAVITSTVAVVVVVGFIALVLSLRVTKGGEW